MTAQSSKQQNKRNDTLTSLVLMASLLINTLTWGSLAIQMFQSNQHTTSSVQFDNADTPSNPWINDDTMVVMHVNLPGRPSEKEDGNKVCANPSTQAPPLETLQTDMQEEYDKPQESSQIASQTNESPVINDNSPFTCMNTDQEVKQKSPTHSLLKKQALAALLKTNSSSLNTTPIILQTNVMKEWLQKMEGEVSDNQTLDLSGTGAINRDAKYFSIRKRLRKHLVTSCKIALRHASFAAKKAFVEGKSASLHIEVNADGTLACLRLLASSGSDALDNTLLRAIETSEPFPPLPKHLGISKYCVSDTIAFN